MCNQLQSAKNIHGHGFLDYSFVRIRHWPMATAAGAMGIPRSTSRRRPNFDFRAGFLSLMISRGPRKLVFSDSTGKVKVVPRTTFMFAGDMTSSSSQGSPPPLECIKLQNPARKSSLGLLAWARKRPALSDPPDVAKELPARTRRRASGSPPTH